jgi:hypothetical protein
MLTQWLAIRINPLLNQMFFVSSGIIISEASSSELMVDDWFTNLDQFPLAGKNENI